MLKLELELQLKPRLKLMLGIWWLISSCLLLKIDAHCLRELPMATTEAGSTRHMWQPQYPTVSQADTVSCNRPTTLRPATDSNVATSQQNGNATASNQTVASQPSPVVTLANYVYQCAAKRESSLSKPSTTNSNSDSIDLAMSNEIFQAEPLGHEQQMTVPAIVFQLSKHAELE